MPNWCQDTIKFYSENKEQIERMLEDFKRILDGPPTEDNGFGEGWMGDFANVYLSQYGGAEEANCRGWVSYIDSEVERIRDYYVFMITTETAWGPKMSMWAKIVEENYPDVKIAFMAEEPGCGVFCVWDETENQLFFPDSYYLDGCLVIEGSNVYIDDRYHTDIDGVFATLDEVLPFEYEHTSDIDALEKEINSKFEEMGDNDSRIYICKFEEEQPAVCD